MTIVAVYGTLRKGASANSLMGNSAYLGRDTVKGHLFDLGNFPGYRKEVDGAEPKEVVVDLYQVGEPQVLENLDNYEGYRAKNPEGSFYIREKIKTVGGVEDVNIYVFNQNPYGPEMDEPDWLRERGIDVA